MYFVTMKTIIIRCPDCRSAAVCESANFIGISSADVGSMRLVKNIHVVETKGWTTHRPYYHAVHYPSIAPALENIKDLPEKYAAGKWDQGFNVARQSNLPECVVRCVECGFLKTHNLNWPEEAFFKVEYRGQILWAYDRAMALKILSYIESDDRKKRIISKNAKGEDDYNYIVQDYVLRKLPEHFQTTKARPEVSKKLRKILGLPKSK